MKTLLLLVQVGSPKGPSVRDVRAYLRKFLSDPKVVEISPYLWKPILYLFILPTRPKQSAKAYQRIWDGKSFPLITITEQFADALEQEFKNDGKENVFVRSAYLLQSPSLKERVDHFLTQVEQSPYRIIVIPQFPQASMSTTEIVYDEFLKLKNEKVLNIEFAQEYATSRCFIDESIKQIREFKGEHSGPLVISFHGTPKERVFLAVDDYYKNCFETYTLIHRGLIQQGLKGPIYLSFQSRFGPTEWLTPYTDELVKQLAPEHAEIFVYCPSFVVDCLETIDEIAHELDAQIRPLGSQVRFIACLNSKPSWARSYCHFLQERYLNPEFSQSELYYNLDQKDYHKMPEQKMKSPPLSPKAKKSIKIVFFTLFLDILGFSIIFPMFPALAKYYLQMDQDNYFLGLIFNSINHFLAVGDGTVLQTPIVLFGGFLGALYSLLQFLFAPFWGSLSDRFGRKSILLVSMFGLSLSYVIWFFAGNFSWLILGRFIGGVMGGNISTASAVVADVTVKENRSKGMAWVGIAIGMGFLFGPAIGGLSTLLDFTTIFPKLVAYGVNPFSVAALVAFMASMINFLMLLFYFEESLPPAKRQTLTGERNRSVNPLLLFRPLPYKGVNLTNLGNFLYLLAFSGMEFTLTFLVVERFHFSSLENGKMFIFIGVILMLVQGGFVRRKAHQIGEKKMSLLGLIIILPGLLLIGASHNVFVVYSGLFFLATGSAMVIPCLTSLVSLYTPADHQGRALGIFRSLGALGRVVGPICACLIYWKWGSSIPYYAGAVFLLIPMALVFLLPPLKENV